jgi:hypothetical protein
MDRAGKGTNRWFSLAAVAVMGLVAVDSAVVSMLDVDF